MSRAEVAMDSALYYSLNSSRLGTAAIINNLHTEQEPTQKDVTRMAQVLEEIGFNVEIHCDLTSQGMNSLKRQLTLPELHVDASCFLLLVISRQLPPGQGRCQDLEHRVACHRDVRCAVTSWKAQ